MPSLTSDFHPDDMEACLQRFEKAWREGVPPRLEDFLPLKRTQRRLEVLRELIKLDMEFRWRSSANPGAEPIAKHCLEVYLQQFPELGSCAQGILGLIVEEYRVRRRWGDSPGQQEYRKRFPNYGPELEAGLHAMDLELAAEFSNSASGEFVDATTLPPSEASDERSPETCLPRLANYEVLEELGRGGMGVVYKAKQTGLQRLVAIKMILAGSHAGPQELARFRTEAEAVARLKHPNIVQIFEIGDNAGMPYFSMEFCEHGSLAKKLNGTPLPPRDAARMVSTLARGVRAAHERSILHRDLKPHNVLFAEDGTPKITDFGLAKKLETANDPKGEGGLTATNAIVGTPSYMAPEQAGGKSKCIGLAADIYALGAILYECLTGRPPFKAATTLDTIFQVIYEEPVSPRRLNVRVPRDLETICLKCLHKDARRRYGSADELAQDLSRYLAGEPILARPITAIQRSWMWAKRHPARAISLALLLAFLVGGSAGGVLLWRQTVERSRAQDVAQRETYFSAINRADRDWQLVRPARAELALEQCPVGLRHWEWHFLKHRNTAASAVFPKINPGRGPALLFSPDGKYLAASSIDHPGVQIWNGKNWHKIKPFPGVPDGKISLAWPGPAELLAVHDSGKLAQIDCRQGTHKAVPVAGFKGTTEVILSADKQLVASADGKQVPSLWKYPGLTPAPPVGNLLAGNEDGSAWLALHPRAKSLAIAVGTRQKAMFQIMDLSGGREIFRRELPNGLFQCPVFSADGTLVAVTTRGRDTRTGARAEIVVYDAANGQLQQTMRGHKGSVEGLAFFNDGERLVSAGSDQTIRFWNRRHEEEDLILHEAAEILAMSLHPDNHTLACQTSDGTIRLWDTRREQGVHRVLRHQGGSTNHLAFTSNGDLITASADGELRLWDIDKGSVRASAPHPGPWRGTVQLSCDPAGRRVASAAKADAVKVWDIPSLKLRAVVPHSKANAVLFSPDGALLATAGDDNVVCLWNARSFVKLATLDAHKGQIHHLAFHPGSKLLASTSHDGTIRLWDLEKGDSPRSLRFEALPKAPAFDPKGEVLAFGHFMDIVLIDVKSERRLHKLIGHILPVTALAWSPDGQRLASASDDGSIKLWEPATGKEILGWRAEPGGVAHLAFDPSGHLLASSAFDGTVKIWNGRPEN